VLDDLAADGQPQARALAPPTIHRIAGLGLMELVENLLQGVARHPLAGIGHFQTQRPVRHAGPQTDTPPIRKFRGVAEQIDQNLA